MTSRREFAKRAVMIPVTALPAFQLIGPKIAAAEKSGAEASNRADSTHCLNGLWLTSCYQRGTQTGRTTAQKLEIRRRSDGSATLRIFDTENPGPALASVDIPSPAGDAILSALFPDLAA